MEIYVFDNQINLLGIIEDYFSVRWVRRYSKCGEFELHAGLNETTLEYFKVGHIVYKSDDEESGIIEHVHLKQDDSGREVMIVKGNFLAGIMDRRIIWNTERINTTAEKAIRRLINNHAISPTNPDRVIPLLQLGELRDYTGQITFQVSYSNLLGQVERVAATNGLGFKSLLDFENKKMIIQIYQGKDRTSGQTINPRAIFSQEFENILEQEYVDSFIDYKNIALIGGQGVGVDRSFVVEGAGVGLNRYELFVDAKDIEQAELSTEEYEEKLSEQGKMKLSEFPAISTFESSVNLKSNLEYKKDFDLGDKVTFVSKAWGLTVDSRIEEIEEVYEESGMSINVVFGNEMPTLIEKIKAVFT